MSRHDVYQDEMPRNVLSDQDIETLFRGFESAEESLNHLTLAVRALHRVGPMSIHEEKLEALAAEAAVLTRAAKEIRPTRADLPKPEKRMFGSTLKRRLAGGLAAAVMLSGMTGVAVAADGARPGDALYGLDRALEAVGIGAGGAAERLAEARALLEAGEVSNAITQVAEVVEETGAFDGEETFSPEAVRASEALRGAAQNIADTGRGPGATGTRTEVAQILTRIADLLEANDFDGANLGETISEMAREMGGNDGPALGADPSSQGDRDNGPDGRSSQGNPPAGRERAPNPPGPPEPKSGGQPSRP